MNPRLLVTIALVAMLAGCLDGSSGNGTKTYTTTFPIGGCRFYIGNPDKAFDGCAVLVANLTSPATAGGMASVTFTTPVNTTAITIVSHAATSSPAATLKLTVNGTTYERPFVAGAPVDGSVTLENGGLRTRSGTILVACGVLNVTVEWSEPAAPMPLSYHHVQVHPARDLERSKENGQASCSGYFGDGSLVA
jgi:hypothetical protein